MTESKCKCKAMHQSAYLNQHAGRLSLSLFHSWSGGWGVSRPGPHASSRVGRVDVVGGWTCLRVWRAAKVEDAGRLAPLATSLLSLGHQADSLTSVTVPCQSVAVWAVGRAVCAQCSGCLVAAASLYRCWRDLHVRITTHKSTQFTCSLVQTAPLPQHREIPRHLRKFRGSACYSAEFRGIYVNSAARRAIPRPAETVGLSNY